MQNIIVVAEDALHECAIELIHHISKNEGAKASLYTSQKYKDNEHKITGKNYVLFLGLNSISKHYISLIPEKYNKLGVIWGYDGP